MLLFWHCCAERLALQCFHYDQCYGTMNIELLISPLYPIICTTSCSKPLQNYMVFNDTDGVYTFAFEAEKNVGCRLLTLPTMCCQYLINIIGGVSVMFNETSFCIALIRSDPPRVVRLPQRGPTIVSSKNKISMS